MAEFEAYRLYFEYIAYNALPKVIDRAAGEDAAFKLIVDALSEGGEKLFDQVISKALEAGYVKQADISMKESSMEHVIEHTVKLQISVLKGKETDVQVEKVDENTLRLTVADPYPKEVYKDILAAAVFLGMLKGLLQRTLRLPVYVIRRKQIASNPQLWRTVLRDKPGAVVYIDKLPSEAQGKLSIVIKFIKPS